MELAVETPLNPVEPDSNGETSPAIVRFTAETARLAGIKSAQIRAATKLTAQQKPLNPVADPFMRARRDKLRAHMLRLDALMDAENDAGKLDRLASALQKIAEEERKADGRPLPGSRKPGVEKVPKQTFSEPQ